MARSIGWINAGSAGAGWGCTSGWSGLMDTGWRGSVRREADEGGFKGTPADRAT